MNYKEFSNLVDEFLGVADLRGKLPILINQAKVELQRQHLFNFALVEKNETYPSTASTGLMLPSDFRALFSNHAVSINGAPLTGTTWEDEQHRLNNLSSYTGNIGGLAEASVTQPDLPVRYFIQPGTGGVYKLFIRPEPLDLEVKYFYHCWLPPYTDDNDTDFLLTAGYDVLLYQTVMLANQFLQDEDKTAFPMRLYQQALATLISADNQTLQHGSAIEL